MIIIDGHVHLYKEESLSEVLDYADRNFGNVAGKTNYNDKSTDIILLADTKRTDWRRKLVEKIRLSKRTYFMTKEWKICGTKEDESLCAYRENVRYIYIVFGQQIVSKENIEILAICTNYKYDDGKKLEGIISSIFNNEDIALLPWGFGKWSFQRKQIVKNVTSFYNSNLLVGDNGGRPIIQRTPKILREAENIGTRVISGSDPLPLKGENRRIGAFGTIIEAEIDKDRPAASLKDILKNENIRSFGYGKQMNIFSFVRNQFLIRMNKRYK
jgi:hypothetical protein